MDEERLNTEQKVYEAAKKVFLQKGLQGARMQEIADEAGINKSLLHYYFRTKDKLFQVIFEDTVLTLFKNIVSALEEEGDIFQKIEQFIARYINFIKDNPFMPQFVMHIIMQNPDMLIEVFKKLKVDPRKQVLGPIQKAMDEGKIIKMKPEHLLLNLISMIIFPFAAKPVIMKILRIPTDKEFNELMDERTELLPEFIKKAVKIK